MEFLNTQAMLQSSHEGNFHLQFIQEFLLSENIDRVAFLPTFAGDFGNSSAILARNSLAN